MRAFLRNNKIILRNEDKEEIELAISLISREFEKLQRACEDRTQSNFPVDTVKKIIEQENKIKKLGGKIFMDNRYLDHVIENKEALGYFESKIKEYEGKINDFQGKINVLKKFAGRLEEENLF